MINTDEIGVSASEHIPELHKESDGSDGDDFSGDILYDGKEHKCQRERKRAKTLSRLVTTETHRVNAMYLVDS